MLIHFASTCYQVQQLKDKVAEIQVLAGAFWRFLCFEMDFLLSRSFQLVTVTINWSLQDQTRLRLHLIFSGFNIEYSSMFYSVDRRRVLPQMRQQNSNSKR